LAVINELGLVDDDSCVQLAKSRSDINKANLRC